MSLSALPLSRRRFGVLLAVGVGGGLVGAVVLSGPGGAAPATLTAPEAHDRLIRGDLVLIDIRARSEWEATGLARGAWPVSMHEAGFEDRLAAILARHLADRVALICARGGRSNALARRLAQGGIAGLIDVPEGMLGRGSAPGWIGQGLPVVSLSEAQQGYDAAMSGVAGG